MEVGVGVGVGTSARTSVYELVKSGSRIHGTESSCQALFTPPLPHQARLAGCQGPHFLALP